MENDMYKTITALALAASLFALPAIAQQHGADHGARHTQAPGGAGAGPGTGMGHGMGHGMGAQTSAPLGDQSPASLALHAVNEKMHREMSMPLTGRPDEDFVRAMIVHHQGAIDMARVVKGFGEDPQIRELANAIIEAQEEEIVMMQEWLAENAPQ